MSKNNPIIATIFAEPGPANVTAGVALSRSGNTISPSVTICAATGQASGNFGISRGLFIGSMSTTGNLSAQYGPVSFTGGSRGFQAGIGFRF